MIVMKLILYSPERVLLLHWSGYYRRVSCMHDGSSSFAAVLEAQGESNLL